VTFPPRRARWKPRARADAAPAVQWSSRHRDRAAM